MRFVVFNGRYETLLEVDLPSGGPSPSFPVRETQRIGFAVEDADSVGDYQIHVGDQALEENLRHQLWHQIQWELSSCFDGANGITPVLIKNTSSSQILARTYALVEPSKLSVEAYKNMYGAISRISIELLLDLVAKSRLSLGDRQRSSFGANTKAVSARLELSRIRRLWSGFSDILTSVLDAPITMLVSRDLVRRLRPNERVNPRFLRHLTSNGRPAKRALREGLVLALPTMSTTDDVPENRVIVGFVELLRKRVLRSRAVAEDECWKIRSRLQSYSETDAALHKFVLRREGPKLSKLVETIAVTTSLAAEMSHMIQQFGISHNKYPAGSVLADLDTPAFRSHPIYSRVGFAIRSFLTQTAMVVEQGDDEAAKGLETLYEQWVFFETCGAIRAAGLRCVSHKSLFAPISRNRFSVDLDRNAAIVFEALDGRRVSVRYEPTILPRASAQGVDTVFRGHAQTPWTPDLILEVLEPRGGLRDYQLVYGVVIDAKYTSQRNIEQKLDDVSKYQEIRSVANGKQIVRQVWVAAPVETMIMPRDETILWSADGEMTADPADVVLGLVGVDPATPEDTANTMKSLVFGILNHARDFALHSEM